jgi:asparagine synthetase B (glutamine-hydrolysing)
LRAAAAAGLRHLLFAGRIANRAELRNALASEGGGAAAADDAGLVAAVLGAWGPAGLGRIAGGFAFAGERSDGSAVILARDALGLRPLFWATDGKQVKVAARIEPLLAHSGRAPDERAVLEWLLYRYVMPPATLFRDIRALPQGCWAELPAGSTDIRAVPYVDAAAVAAAERYRALDRAPESEVLDELEGLLLGSVERACAGRTRVGVLLSGGVDSATIAAMARRFAEVTALTVGMTGGPGLDESGAARATARQLGIPIEVLPVSPRDYALGVAEATREAEAPLFHVTNVGFNVGLGPLLARARALGLDRVLTGDYAGTTLGAPTGPASLRWLLPIRAALRRAPAGVGPALSKLVLDEAGLPATVMEFAQSVPPALRLVDGGQRARRLAEAGEASAFIPDELERRMRASRIANLAVWFPRYHDRTARLGDAHGVEVVLPYIDRALLALSLDLPIRYLRRREGRLALRSTDKWALRQVARRHLGEIQLYHRAAGWQAAQEHFVAPLAARLLTPDGFCADLFGLGADELARELHAWRTDPNTLAKMVHLEVWGRVWFMGQRADELGERLATLVARNGGA